jgi:alcohol dehydrogenase class IV
MAVEGAQRAMRALLAVAANPAAWGSETTWDDLSLASLWGGMALANAGLGAVHGLAAPLGGRCSIPHGAACAALLAPTIRANVEALASREPNAPALARYAELAHAITGDADTAHFVQVVDDLHLRLGAKSLAEYGAKADDVSPIVASSRGGSMKNNPVTLTDAELEAVLRAAGRF